MEAGDEGLERHGGQPRFAKLSAQIALLRVHVKLRVCLDHISAARQDVFEEQCTFSGLYDLQFQADSRALYQHPLPKLVFFRHANQAW